MNSLLRLRSARTFAVAFILSLLFTSCSQKGTPQPEEIYAEDICGNCRMAISNPRYAAELITSSEVLKFDDFGCMISHERKIDERIVAAYVKDYETMAWVAREEASYVHSKEIPTPMGFGIVAVADGKRAETLAAKVSGRVIDLGEARELVDKP